MITSDDVNGYLQGQKPSAGLLAGQQYAQQGDDRNVNFDQAQKDMGLNQQEQDLYQRHLQNLWGEGGVDNPDGSRSSLYVTTATFDDRTYVIPTVHEGKILDPATAIEMARKSGLDKFPSYDSVEEAQKRYQQMHQFMEKDTFQRKNRKGSSLAGTRVAGPYQIPGMDIQVREQLGAGAGWRPMPPANQNVRPPPPANQNVESMKSLSKRIQKRLENNPRAQEKFMTPEQQRAFDAAVQRSEARTQEILGKLPEKPTTADIYRAVTGKEPPQPPAMKEFMTSKEFGQARAAGEPYAQAKSFLQRIQDGTKGMSREDMLASEPIWGGAKRLSSSGKMSFKDAFHLIVEQIGNYGLTPAEWSKIAEQAMKLGIR